MAEGPHCPSVALALQGGGSHGAFTWGVLDRLLDAVAGGVLRIAALSGASAGALNAAITATGLALGGPAEAQRRLRAFWRSVSRGGLVAGNPLFGLAEPGAFGFDIDWNPVAIGLEAAGLVISPYTNPFYADALRPLLERALPPADLARLNAPGAAPPLFVDATDVRDNARAIFTQPDISVDALRASAALPDSFRAVSIDGVPYWDGGFMGNPPLSPLIDVAQDLLIVMTNPLHRTDMPPTSARAILARLNEITGNASVVLEINAIEAVNRLLAELPAGTAYQGRYRPVRLHLIRDDRFMATLGVVSKRSTAWSLISALFEAGRETASSWLARHAGSLGVASSLDVRAELIHPVMKAAAPKG